MPHDSYSLGETSAKQKMVRLVGAVHDGNATGTPVPDENTLGCRVLFHTGLSGGYRLTEQWTALLTWDHISNAHLCAHNAGMNDYGVKIGYSF